MIQIEKKLLKLSKDKLQKICKKMKKRYTQKDSKQRLIEILMKPLGKKYKIFGGKKNIRPRTPPRKHRRNIHDSTSTTELIFPTLSTNRRTPPRRKQITENKNIVNYIFNITRYILHNEKIITDNIDFFRDKYNISDNFFDEIDQYTEYFYKSSEYLKKIRIYLENIANDIKGIIEYNNRLESDYQEQIKFEEEMKEKFRQQAEQAKRDAEKLNREAKEAKEAEERYAEKRRKYAEERQRYAEHLFEEQQRRRRYEEQRRREAKYGEPMDIDDEYAKQREAEQRRREAEQRRREAKKTNPCYEYFPEHLTSKKEIKKAYHKLVLKYHPDKKGGNKEKFQEIQKCYEEKENK